MKSHKFIILLMGSLLLQGFVLGCAHSSKIGMDENDNGSPSNMSFIRAGNFEMGSNVEEDERPVHTIYLDAFYIDQYEITQQEYEDIMGKNPSMFRGENFPVHRVTWYEAREFCKKVGKRLPTEAEWEKAQRGSTQTEFYWGKDDIDDYAWHSGNSNKEVHAVGQKKTNAFDLYDMAGNVYEWVSDWYAAGAYKEYSKKNPRGPKTGKRKVIRGGSWFYDAEGLRSAKRDSALPTDRNIGAGFRCAKDIK